MNASIDYNYVLGSQYKQVNQKVQKFLFSIRFVIPSLFKLYLSRKLNRRLTNHLFLINSVHSYLLKNVAEIKGKNLRPQIEIVENVLMSTYDLQHYLETHLEKEEAFAILCKIVAEMLEVIHDTTILLKKNSLKIPIRPRSKEAEFAVLQSQATIKKIFYGR